MRIESTVRDFLAQNLSLISDELTLIKKEFPLKANIGAKGFVDILAKDSLNNFVIIEIKRADAAARQTMNELLKYQGLLKQQFNAREDEIKLIVISTSWHELIVPFSEIYNRVSIEGFKIELNNNNQPSKIEKVKPLSLDKLARKFSPEHSLDLFFSSEKRDKFINVIKENLKSVGIQDFVFLKLKNLEDKKIMYPYISYLAFQRQPKEFYFHNDSKLSNHLKDCEFDSDEEEYSYIEGHFLSKFNKHKINDSAEHGYPAKFMNIIGVEGWEIEEIMKFGVFETDPRFTDEMLINEIKGYDGTNEIRYLDFADSSQPKKLQSVKSNFKTSLSNNVELINHLNSIFQSIESKQTEYRVVVDIFYPYSIFDSLYKYFIKGNINLLPCYNLFFILKDTNEIYQYRGKLVWNGESISVNALLSILDQEKNPFSLFKTTAGHNDEALLKILNIYFSNELLTIKNNEIESIHDIKSNDNKIQIDDRNHHSLNYFEENNKHIIDIIYKYYGKFIFEVE